MINHSDWTAIYAYFISSEKITLKDCADKFGSSYDSLRQKSSIDGWKYKKQKVYSSAIRMIETRTIEEIKKRNEEQIKQAQLLQNTGVDLIVTKGFRPNTFDEARKAIEVGQQLERIALGMNNRTDKIRIVSTNQF